MATFLGVESMQVTGGEKVQKLWYWKLHDAKEAEGDCTDGKKIGARTRSL